MDGGPFRAPQPAERRAVSRIEPVPEPRDGLRDRRDVTSSRIPRDKRLPRWLTFTTVLVGLIAILGVGGYFAWHQWTGSNTGIDKSKYQAVFLKEGQPVFGKLAVFNSKYFKLTDIFYLQSDTNQPTDGNGDSTQNPASTANSSSQDFKLVKFGSEIYGPEDEMMIPKDQVLYYLNLSSDGKVTQTIDKYNKSR